MCLGLSQTPKTAGLQVHHWLTFRDKTQIFGSFFFSFVPLPWQHRLHPPEQHLNVSSRPAATNDWFAAAPFSLKKIFGSCLLMGLPFVNVCLRLLQMDLDMLLCTEWHIKVENYNLPL